MEENRHMNYEDLRLNQNLIGGILGGLVAAIIAATLWAGIVVLTERQFGIAAIGVGLLVGVAIRKFGKGVQIHFAIIGALLALFGCVLGNFLAVMGFVLLNTGMSVVEILPQINIPLVIEVIRDSFEPSDLIFYGIAAYEAYKLSVITLKKVETTREA